MKWRKKELRQIFARLGTIPLENMQITAVEFLLPHYPLAHFANRSSFCPQMKNTLKNPKVF